MQQYLKLFETENNRTAYENGESYIEPYVSYVDAGDVHYNKVPDLRVIVTYNVTDASQTTKLYAYQPTTYEPQVIGADLFNKIEIDDTDVNIQNIDTASGQYQLSVGEHIVKYTLKDATILPLNIFRSCNKITTVVLPESITSIGGEAFASCSSLTDINIPSSVTRFNGQTFLNCSSLTDITLSNGLTNIGYREFEQCSTLTNITIPSGVTSVGSQAFLRCSSLISITILATTPPSLGNNSFDYNASGRKFYVPAEAVDTYKRTWSSYGYASDIEAIPTT